MTVLVTGGLGFIGFNALVLWKKLKPDWKFIVVDNITYAAKYLLEEKLQFLVDNNIMLYRYDISKKSEEMNHIFIDHKINAIVNFAAESHVDNSISGPEIFFNTNIIGTVNMLEYARKYNLRYHQISTDEVYGVTYPEDKCDENYRLEPSSPYSSSKTSADLITLSYYKTFGINATISRCTNNFGPWQHPEKLIPTVITKALNNDNIPVYGDGKQRRHWIHVDEHNRCILDILINGISGQIYNIAPSHSNYISNLEIINSILGYLGKDTNLITHVKDRAAHDTSYYVYSTYYPCSRHYTEDLNETIEWYKQHN